ncbi:MAG: hypothetical protein KAR06_04215 [Deltaproteobacteria bacterium]|nr:hypothetical protein [Deltaproteobacteria bacterium]
MADGEKTIKLLKKETARNQKTIAKLKQEIEDEKQCYIDLEGTSNDTIAGLLADIATLRKSFDIVHGYIVAQIDTATTILQARHAISVELRTLIKEGVSILARLGAHKIEWPKDKE